MSQNYLMNLGRIYTAGEMINKMRNQNEQSILFLDYIKKINKNNCTPNDQLFNIRKDAHLSQLQREKSSDKSEVRLKSKNTVSSPPKELKSMIKQEQQISNNLVTSILAQVMEGREQNVIADASFNIKKVNRNSREKLKSAGASKIKANSSLSPLSKSISSDNQNQSYINRRSLTPNEFFLDK